MERWREVSARLERCHDERRAARRAQRQAESEQRRRQHAEQEGKRREQAREAVRTVQSAIKKCGFNPGPIDGVWGRKTAAAAANFIRAHGGSPSSDRASLMAQVDGHRVGDAGQCPPREPEQGHDVQTVKKMLDKREDTDSTQLDLSGLDLTQADFSGQDFGRDNLSNANLSNANLTQADLSQADLKGTNLTGATLDRANLIGQDLSEAVMDGASLVGARISGAIVSAKTKLTLGQAAVADWSQESAEAVRDLVPDENLAVAKSVTTGTVSRMVGGLRGAAIGGASIVISFRRHVQGVHEKALDAADSAIDSALDTKGGPEGCIRTCLYFRAN